MTTLQLLREIALLRESVKEKESQILQLQQLQPTQQELPTTQKTPPEVSQNTPKRDKKVNCENKAIQNDGPMSSKQLFSYLEIASSCIEHSDELAKNLSIKSFVINFHC